MTRAANVRMGSGMPISTYPIESIGPQVIYTPWRCVMPGASSLSAHKMIYSGFRYVILGAAPGRPRPMTSYATGTPMTYSKLDRSQSGSLLARLASRIYHHGPPGRAHSAAGGSWDDRQGGATSEAGRAAGDQSLWGPVAGSHSKMPWGRGAHGKGRSHSWRHVRGLGQLGPGAPANHDKRWGAKGVGWNGGSGETGGEYHGKRDFGDHRMTGAAKRRVGKKKLWEQRDWFLQISSLWSSLFFYFIFFSSSYFINNFHRFPLPMPHKQRDKNQPRNTSPASTVWMTAGSRS